MQPASPAKKEKLSSTVKICLVGTGPLGQLRLGIIAESRKADVVAVVEPESAARAQLQQLTAPVYAALADVRERYDAVWVAVGAEQRADAVAAVAASAKARFVFCEAPIAPTEADVRRAYDACAGRGLELVAGWYRRFDEGFAALFDRSQSAHVASAKFTNKRGLPPPAALQQQTLQQTQQLQTSPSSQQQPALGTLFREMVAHDLNLALLFMNEQMPLSVQATARDTYGTGVCDSAWVNLEYPGGKSVFVEAVRYGRGKYENSVRLVVRPDQTLSSGRDCAAQTPIERYAQALRSEVSHFARRCGLERVVPRCAREQCIATAQLIEAAEQSALIGSKVPVMSEAQAAARIVQVSAGPLAKHIRHRVLGQLASCETIAVVDLGEDGEDVQLQLQPLLDRQDVDGVHVCLFPSFRQQSAIVELCLAAGKRVICAPPLLDLRKLCAESERADKLLMVDFPRRFDRQFLRAKELITQLATDGGAISSIVLEDNEIVLDAAESEPFDPVEAVWESCIHDLDLLAWLLEDSDCEISIRSVHVNPAAATIVVSLPVWLRKYDRQIEAQLSYSRGSKRTVHRVIVNGEFFGHDGRQSPVALPNVYDDARERAFKFFSQHPQQQQQQQQQQHANGTQVHIGRYCRTYIRGFDLTEQVADMVADQLAEAIAQHEAEERRRRHQMRHKHPLAGSDASTAQSPSPATSPASPSPPISPSEYSSASSMASSSAAISLYESTRSSAHPLPPIPLSEMTPKMAAQALAVLSAHRAAEQDAAVKEFQGVAGHGGMFTQGGKIYKPLMYEENEWRVYQSIREQLPELLPWVPTIHERVMVNGSPFIVMEDLTFGYRRPVVLDLKVGEPSDFFRLHNQPYAIKVAGYTGNTIVRRSQQSWTDLLSYFKDFIKDKSTGNSRYEVIPDFVEQLKQLLALFTSQTLLRMRAVSLLFIFDGTDSGPQRPSVRIVDLARAVIIPDQHFQEETDLKIPSALRSADDTDHHFCFGLENVRKLLETIHAKFVNRHAVFLCRHGLLAPPAAANGGAARAENDDLSLEGMQQAYDMASRLKHENISILVTSPFRRAVQTARLIAEQLGIKYVVEPAMSATDRPLPASLSLPVAADEPFYDRDFVPTLSFPDAAASPTPPTPAIACQALTQICSRYKRVVIIGHTSTFVGIVSTLAGQQLQGPLNFASITSLLPSAGTPLGWSIERMNMKSHLTVFRDMGTSASSSLVQLPPVPVVAAAAAIATAAAASTGAVMPAPQHSSFDHASF